MGYFVLAGKDWKFYILYPWGKKPKKIAFYPKKMVHEGLNHSIILTPTSSSRNEHIALLCLLFNVFLTDNFELGLILDGYDPFGE